MKTEALRHDTDCRLCGNNSISTVLKLNATPLEDMFVKQEQLSAIQEIFPLEQAICRDCGYLHLPHIVSPEVSYSDYLYESKITLGLSKHYDEYAAQVLELTEASKDSLVVDLGSNDGTMLAAFKGRGMRVLGVEPATAIAQTASAAGIPTIPDFFTNQVVEEIVENHGTATIITANYMYANIDNLQSFTSAVSQLLDPNGVFVIQTGYHPEQMKILMFDYIYHEHFSYFSVKVLAEFLARHKLQVIDAAKTAAKGGSVRVVAQHSGAPRSVSSHVSALIKEEESAGIEKLETFESYSQQIAQRKSKTTSFLQKLADQGKRIVGYGASHSTTTLTYHFELGSFMEYIVDDNPLKHGMFSPGYHLPVFPSSKIYDDQPDYIVVLAWQYRDAILERNKKFIDQGGRFIVPLPQFAVV